jgi:hypothetical protein
MWLVNLSRKVILIIIFAAIAIEIIIPNMVVRLFSIPILRPGLFSFTIFALGFLMILGLLSEYFHIRYDKAYGSRKGNRLRFYITLPIAVLIILFIFFQSYLIFSDIAAHVFNGQPYRTIQATITNRTGLPGVFIIGDGLVLDGTMQVTLPYSDFPAVGRKYTFTLLPTDNIIVDYRPI